MINSYIVTAVGSTPAEWIISQNGAFIGQYTSLALALAYLATVLVFGDSIVYENEPVTTQRI